MDYEGIRRCWNTIRLHFDPIFSTKVPSTIWETSCRPLHNIYRFLIQRGEVFQDKFPQDTGKWLPIFEMLRLTFYVEGEGQHGKIFMSAKIQNKESDQFWVALRNGDLEAVANLLYMNRSLANHPSPSQDFPLTYAAERGDLYLVKYLLLYQACVNAPGMYVTYVESFSFFWVWSIQSSALCVYLHVCCIWSRFHFGDIWRRVYYTTAPRCHVLLLIQKISVYSTSSKIFTSPLRLFYRSREPDCATLCLRRSLSPNRSSPLRLWSRHHS